MLSCLTLCISFKFVAHNQVPYIPAHIVCWVTSIPSLVLVDGTTLDGTLFDVILRLNFILQNLMSWGFCRMARLASILCYAEAQVGI